MEPTLREAAKGDSRLAWPLRITALSVVAYMSYGLLWVNRPGF